MSEDGEIREQPGRAPVGVDEFSRWLGLRWEAPDRIRMTVRPDHLNVAGMLAGPVSFALIDYCMGSALWVHTREDEHIATLNIAINYIQTAREGDIVCSAELDRRNDRNAVLRSEVRREDGALMCTALGSFSIFPPRGRRRASGPVI
jgi:uncharacterized protein (TIGR00369 family)